MTMTKTKRIQTELNSMKLKHGLGTLMPSSQHMEWVNSTARWIQTKRNTYYQLTNKDTNMSIVQECTDVSKRNQRNVL